MKKIIYLIFLIQSGFMIAQSVTVPTINGKKVTFNPSASLTSADNGLTATGNNVQLGGALTKPSVVTTTSAFTLAIKGLQTGALTDQLVTADANGVLRAIPNNYWSTNGNAGTVAGTNFLGTTDNVDLVFKRGGVQSGLIQNVTLQKGNTSFGYEALNSASTGVQNTAIGARALANNTTGDSNVAIGHSALLNNTSGYGNHAIGFQALAMNTSGGGNFALGYNVLGTNSTGSYNIGIGSYALGKNPRSDYNVGIGSQSLGELLNGKQNTAIGYLAISGLQVGENNVGIGTNAGLYSTGPGEYVALTRLSGSILIGKNAATNTDDQVNTIVIGSDAVGQGSNTVQIGNGSMTKIGGAVAWSNPSDVRLKKDIVSSTHGLDFVSKLRPVTYHMKTGTTDLQSGFIAQEVETAAKAVNYEFSGIVKPASENEFYSLRYSEFVVPLVKAVQEQQQMIESQKADIAELKAQVQALLKAAK